MNLEEYEVMYRLENRHWWFRSRLELVHDLFARMGALAAPDGSAARILDLACGTGSVLESLRTRGHALGVDLSMTALGFCRQRGLGSLARCRGEELAFRDRSLDLVVSMDCFEHIQDDVAAMAECHRVLRPGGFLMVNVPAFGFLWSEHDEALHHRRRFTRSELVNKLEHVGFSVNFSTYLLFLLFFPALMDRIARNLRKNSVRPRTGLAEFPRWIDGSLLAVNRVERWFLRRMGRLRYPLGLSVTALATRPVDEPCPR